MWTESLQCLDPDTVDAPQIVYAPERSLCPRLNDPLGQLRADARQALQLGRGGVVEVQTCAGCVLLRGQAHPGSILHGRLGVVGLAGCYFDKGPQSLQESGSNATDAPQLLHAAKAAVFQAVTLDPLGQRLADTGQLHQLDVVGAVEVDAAILDRVGVQSARPTGGATAAQCVPAQKD
jgi:hypothetical protein